MTDLITNDDGIEETLAIFRDYMSGKVTQKQLGEKYGLSQRVISNRINKAREVYYDEIKKIGKKYAADILVKYEKIYDESMTEWEQTKNPAFLQSAMRALADIRMMLKIDEIEEVNKDSEKIVFIIDDTKYRELENNLKQIANVNDNIIDGEIKNID